MLDAARYAGLCAFLRSQAPDLVFRQENDPLNPPAADPWVYVEAESFAMRQASFGSGNPAAELWREEGRAIFLIHAPVNSGSLAARAIGARLARLLRGREVAGMRFGGPILEAGGASDRRAGWWVLPILVPYHFDDLE